MPSIAQQATKFCMPDMVSHCPIPARLNPHHKQACSEADQWFISEAALTEKKRRTFLSQLCTLFPTRCFPYAAYTEMRAICDCLSWFFFIDDISDEMSSLGTVQVAADVMNVLWHTDTYEPRGRIARMCRDFWSRMIKDSSSGFQQRFREGIECYWQGVTQQALDRETGNIPDPESYTLVRRDSGGLKATWALIEYANRLDLPAEVMEQTAIRDLNNTVNDIVCFSNDVFSYSKEQAMDDEHNLVDVLMRHRGMDLQAASDEVGNIVNARLDEFLRQRKDLPSWGPEIDQQIDTYADGLGYWISGNYAWSFETKRFFGKDLDEIKKNRIVTLLPKRSEKGSSK